MTTDVQEIADILASGLGYSVDPIILQNMQIERVLFQHKLGILGEHFNEGAITKEEYKDLFMQLVRFVEMRYVGILGEENFRKVFGRFEETFDLMLGQI